MNYYNYVLYYVNILEVQGDALGWAGFNAPQFTVL
jgi:hypothetical protein